ncbi:MAG: hypothetical protein IGQ88_10380 [Gloeomargaritaceae cyanobacterium C42_A2020_066]|nr:hypothetical protein [Gloeomargaritaceae cyanobacterium C42_A2020_066]
MLLTRAAIGLLLILSALGHLSACQHQVRQPAPSDPTWAKLEAELLTALNQLRLNPRAYAQQIPAGRLPPTVLRDLQQRQSLSPLRPAAGLTQAARDWITTPPKGKTNEQAWASHLRRYGRWELLAARQQSVGYIRGAALLEALLADEGTREHRYHLLHPLYRRVGIACGPEPRHGSQCLIVYAGGFHPGRPAPPPPNPNPP